MLIEAIDQVERAVETLLSAANHRAAASSDFRSGLRRSKGIASKPSAFQTAAASCAAATERHGGGAQIPADTTRLTRNDARRQVKLGNQPGRPAPGTSREISIPIKED